MRVYLARLIIAFFEACQMISATSARHQDIGHENVLCIDDSTSLSGVEQEQIHSVPHTPTTTPAYHGKSLPSTSHFHSFHPQHIQQSSQQNQAPVQALQFEHSARVTQIQDKFDDVLQIVLRHSFWSEFPQQIQGFKMRTFRDMLTAKADGTITCYLYKCREFFSWLKKLNLPVKLPVREEFIATFIVDKASVSTSDSTIITLASAIKWLHSLVNCNPNPVDTSIVQNVVVSQKRNLHKPPQQKEPISFEIVQSIAHFFGNPNCNLMQL
ncbi:uncharacterized protein LOC119742012 [Patiria miniata]|uniref:Integrase SAM-like N-terminal domain-containing protein n=1 Tax=Patiria miniata TaxID=46514 RepID=A0A914BEV0_PATMI|nr:uncharacterized protein LOC119742012 [Patiria miniata]